MDVHAVTQSSWCTSKRMTQKQEGKKLKIVLGNAVSFSKPGIHETLKKKEGEAKGREEGRGEVRGREDMGREVVWRGGQEEWQCMPQNHSSDFECRLQAFAPLLSWHWISCVACQTVFYNWHSRELPFRLSHKKKNSLDSLFSSRTWRSSVLINDLTSHHPGGSLTQPCSLETSRSLWPSRLTAQSDCLCTQGTAPPPTLNSLQ